MVSCTIIFDYSRYRLKKFMQEYKLLVLKISLSIILGEFHLLSDEGEVFILMGILKYL